MKRAAATLLACLWACNRDSLGSFEQNRRMTVAANCWARHSKVDQHEDPDFRCTFDMFASDLEPEKVGCPCVGSVTLSRASNGTDARLLQIQVDHCPHEIAVHGVTNHLDWLLREEELSQLKDDLDEPGQLTSSSMLRADAGMISATGVYGDRAVEIGWSRDNYLQTDGAVAPQPTESYFVAIRPRAWNDLPHGRASKDPRVSAMPRCPP